MKTKTCGDCRWFDGEECNEHEHPVEDNEEACSYFQRKRAKPAAPTAKGWAESDYARRVASIALANGYVKLADDEIVMSRVMARYLIAGGCECCEDEGLSDCGDCEIKPIRDRIEEARDE